MRTGPLRLATAALVAVAALCVGVTPANADGNLGIGLGSSPGVSGLPAGTAGSGTALDIVSSGYTMASVDPLNGTMTLSDLASAMTPSYATTSDLAAQDMLAINAADLARRAKMEEEARRKAAAQGGTAGGLRAGSVPGQYRQMVLDAVANHCPQLAPSVLAAQIEAESNWNPRATSPGVGAQGIAQFMPATWAAHGIDGDRDGRADVWNPADAIASAAKYDCYVMELVSSVPGDPTANMLAAYNAGPGNVRKYRGVPPFSETRAYVAKITANAATMAEESDSTAGAGAAAGPDGCPTSAPSGTLREGAQSVGVATLCAESVAQARTPYAARAIKFALRNLGATYSQPRRMDADKFDCSSYLTRAYDSGGLNLVKGWAPTTYTILAAPWAVKIPFSSRKPGDMVFPSTGHVSMSLARGYKVHTNRTGDVSHVKKDYTSAYATVRVDPARL